MRIEDVWREMEAEAKLRDAPAWLTRFALPEPGRPLLVALESSTETRALLLPISRVEIPSRKEWPDSEGLEVFGLSLEGQPHLAVRLRARSYSDVFSVLAEDVARQVAQAPDAHSAAAAMLSRIARWRKFLAAGTSGLSADRVRGLVGELMLLRQLLIRSAKPAAALASWRAPLRTHQDFQAMGGAIEVKATTAKQPQLIRVTSERQLDGTGLRFLYLHVVILDERTAEADQRGAGETLPAIIADLRGMLRGEEGARETLEERLLDAGFLEADTHRYADRFFALRTERSFLVAEGFPRLLEGQLPPGVGDVSYSLSLAACEPFAVDTLRMIEAFNGSPAAGNPARGASDA